MDYYGLLFLYYLKGLSGKSVLRLFFNIEAGGTEQLLPENASTPTTTPILADIQYPDGLRTDQYFTYRETPTTVSNKARIKTIKGNTLIWNQQHHEQSSTYWSASGASSSYADGVGTFTASSDGTFGQNLKSTYRYSAVGHKYLFIVTVKSSSGGDFNFGLRNAFVTETLLANTEKTVKSIQTATTANDNVILYRANATSGDTLTIKNSMCFDLTQMGLDISSPSDFTSLFPLSYYSYNQGSLLSFNGNGIKTVGFNQWDEEWEVGSISNVGENISSTTEIRAKNYIRVMPNQEYYLHASVASTFNYRFYDADKRFISAGYIGRNNTLLIPNGVSYMRFYMGSAYGTTYKNDICINRSDTERNGIYEPYTSSTLSLPISTYFPTGMNGHGDTYDELTSAVATKRFKKDSLGELTWTRRTTNIFSANLPSEFDASKDISCFMSNRLPTVFVSGYTLAEDGYISIYKTTTVTSSTSIYLNMASQSIDTVADLQTWLSNNPTELVYPLATPTETPITTEDANEALSLLMGKSVSSNNAKQLINIITKGE